MKHRYLSDVATLKYNEDKCIGCEMCETVCPHTVFRISEGKAYITNKDSCMECGACAMNCPEEAITVNAGTGCAAAIMMSWLTGEDPTRGCSDSSGCC